MRLEIFGLNMRINDTLREAIEQKMDKFSRFFDESARGEVKLQPEGNNVRAEVTINIRTHFYRAESVAPEAMTAVEQAIAESHGVSLAGEEKGLHAGGHQAGMGGEGV